ncbi:LOW QUALITY PROTEIN: WD repeat-containing protein 93 [Xyrichtys novacula]|uniref:LOW QUALITY PROTEIN: WD repeat-containing protein 93 n=1 Tax=Xyrichtys novacula TaxID=13765 RepID=A0AAV1EK57_XYRNO|nr:LOW QUALITY PROTEIN: WD repeat-containing protein 93 [Xyrichtys novacula]
MKTRMSRCSTKSTPEPEVLGACKTETPRGETLTLQLSVSAQLPQGTNCLACSEDGMYLSLGHSRGLSVWCASSLSCVAEWLQDTLEITNIQMCRMAEAVYLLSTVDDMGVARVFIYHSERIHLLSVINVMENVNKRSICLAFELSEGGLYGVASLKCSGDVWLEIYHFPTQAWLKELEKESSNNQVITDQNLSGNVDLKWSPVEVSKIKPPKTPAGLTLQSPDKVLNKTDFYMHCLSLDIETEGRPFSEQSGKTNAANGSYRHCTHHFLLPCGQFPGDNKTNSNRGSPVAVCVWWSGSHNLLQYSLKNKPDVEPIPDMIWPNAQEILCSAVSTCTRFIAVGLKGAMLCVWDRQSGAPLAVVVVSAADVFSKVQFLDDGPESADDCQSLTAAEVSLLLVCKSGIIHRVSVGRGKQPFTVQLTERPKDNRDLITVTASVPFLQGLLLMVQRNGKIVLQDVTCQTNVCFLIPTASHLITTPCSPVYTLSTKQQTLFIQGDPKPSCSSLSEGESQSQLFTFHFGDSDIVKKFIISLPDSSQLQTVSCVNLEESCNLYLEQRALSVDERHKSVTDTWKRLQETALALQQECSRSAAS